MGVTWEDERFKLWHNIAADSDCMFHIDMYAENVYLPPPRR